VTSNVTSFFIIQVLAWAQGIIGKEYLVGKELKGKDVTSSRAPQAYGYKTLQDLLKIL
jgi:hypothetical protein